MEPLLSRAPERDSAKARIGRVGGHEHEMPPEAVDMLDAAWSEAVVTSKLGFRNYQDRLRCEAGCDDKLWLAHQWFKERQNLDGNSIEEVEMAEAEVFELGAHRNRLEELPPGEMVIVTFYSGRLPMGDGDAQNLSPSYTVAAARALEFIETVRSNGGMWLPPEGDKLWFLPWPPMAVCIHPASKP